MRDALAPLNRLPKEASDIGRVLHPDKIKKPLVKTGGITRHREGEFRHVIKLPEHEENPTSFPQSDGRRCGVEEFV